METNHEKVTTTQVAVNIMKFFSSIAGDSQVPQQMVKWFGSRIWTKMHKWLV